MNALQRAMIRQKNSHLKSIARDLSTVKGLMSGLVNARTAHGSTSPLTPPDPNATYSLAYSALHPAPGLYVHIEPKFDRVRVKGPRLSVPQYTQKLDIPHYTKYRTFLEAAGYSILPSMRASRLPSDLIKIVSADDLLRAKKPGEVEEIEGIDYTDDIDDTDTDTIFDPLEDIEGGLEVTDSDVDNGIDLGGFTKADLDEMIVKDKTKSNSPSDKLALALSLGLSLVYRTPQDAMKIARPYSGGSEADKRLAKARIQAAGIPVIE